MNNSTTATSPPTSIQSVEPEFEGTARDSESDEFAFDGGRSGAVPMHTTQQWPTGTQEYADLDVLQFLRVQGIDASGRRIVRIVGKFFPAQVIDSGRLEGYLARKFTTDLDSEGFAILYFHTRVSRRENSPGVLPLRRVYENLPVAVRRNLKAIYVVHPGLWSRLFLATVGRFVLTNGFYSKVIYVSRLEFLWDHVGRTCHIDIPEFVMEHDKELEHRPLMDYGLDTDPYGDITRSDFGKARATDGYFG